MFSRLTIITGTGLSRYGLKPTELLHGPTTASYVADNQSAVAFTLPGLPNSDIPTQYNQKFFETLTLPLALHNITVSHGGDPSLTPLVLGSLVVMNGTISKTLAAQISSPFNQNHATHARKLGIIIGHVFAAVVIFIFVSAGVITYFRRRKLGKNNDTELSLPSASQATSPRRTIHGIPTMCACQNQLPSCPPQAWNRLPIHHPQPYVTPTRLLAPCKNRRRLWQLLTCPQVAKAGHQGLFYTGTVGFA